MNNKILGEY